MRKKVLKRIVLDRVLTEDEVNSGLYLDESTLDFSEMEVEDLIKTVDSSELPVGIRDMVHELTLDLRAIQELIYHLSESGLEPTEKNIK